MQKKKNIIIIITAILFGLLGVIIVVYYTGQSNGNTAGNPIANPAAFSQQEEQEEITREVVVAAITIPENTRITAEMLQVKDVPVNTILADTYINPKDIVGAMAVSGIEKEEQVTNAKISKGEFVEEFSYGIPDGKRAVSIDISKMSSVVSGFMQPKDKVDLLVTLAIPEPKEPKTNPQNANQQTGTQTQEEEPPVTWDADLQFFQKVARKLLEGRRIIAFDGKNITFTLFQNVEILAVDRMINRPVAGNPSDDGKAKAKQEGEETVGVSLITLCLDPEQVDLLTNIEPIGFIKFSLRNPGDNEIVTFKPIIEYKLEEILKLAGQ